MAAVLASAACGPLTTPKPTDPDALADYREANDKYEPLNRKMYNLNMKVYKYAFRPVGKAYIWAVPSPVRDALGDMVQTMNEPIVFFTDVGAGRPRRAGDAFVRWTVNMTAGVGGLIDVAKMLGYPHHDDDAGLVLATWGVPSGPYLFLPGMGPSSFRDSAGYGIDVGLSPWNYVPRGYGLLTFNWAYNIAGIINGAANSIDAFDQVQRDALDPYAFIRSAYQQQRRAQAEAIKNDHRATTPDWYN
ncbi:lipoprotein [Ameyamaea chiangmaiensis NBRC 103196]|uniref:VacJ family lipoprotein n=1 Tax=Ameyamaea chiangmaiensis TaxID=442969 RepID=A0A850P649_9PROT|nr:VacJ family lipoprotein [Ameyamaea chiangmaiensis]MBS4075805.1 VacJ family lipoprotein [Ameyamaea chiangmaiensis]NVN39324.1 VacJ family lipoprotein [Ameyamaea chiangmaiensis]GBQ63803.1 lipoprotein [Ameyamaea chiangmaiensis NBRC 103196]